MSGTREEAENVVTTSTPGIGYRLQQARERKKLTIAEVASQLRFTRATLIHLEQEEWDKLHSRTYARGYLLNYVKYLGLPSDDMLSMFNAQYGDTERPTNLLLTTRLTEEKPFPWVSSLLAVVVLISAALIYQYWPQQGIETGQSSVDGSDTSLAGSPALSAPDAQLLDEDAGIRPAPDNAQDTRDVNKLNGTPSIPLVIDSMPADMAESEEQNLTQPSPEIAEVNDAESQAIVTESVEMPPAEPIAGGEAALTLVITEASWVEVKDDSGNTLISRVLEQETVDLTGPTPFTVRIGNVAGTTLRFNGSVVDLEAYRKNNVARLTLGDES